MNIFDITPVSFQINLLDRFWDHDLQVFMEFFLKNQPEGLATGKKGIDIKRKYKRIMVDKQY